LTVFATTAIGAPSVPLRSANRSNASRICSGSCPSIVATSNPYASSFLPERLGALLPAHAPRLPELVAVEDRQHVVQPVVDDEVERLGDLPLARLAVADDAVDALVDLVDPRRLADPRRDREAHAQRAGRGVEEREALHRVGVPVEHAVELAQRLEVVGRQAPALLAGAPDRHAQQSPRRRTPRAPRAPR
jgi:hypothetical protein